VFKKIALLGLIAGLVFGAEGLVSNPEKPMAGQQVSWTLEELAYESGNPVMLLAVYTPDTVLIEVLPGKSTQDGWSFSYTIPQDAIILTYKIEDEEKPLADDDGLFFVTLIYEKSGKPRRDANRLHATLYLDPLADRLDRARQLVEMELKEYPANWEALILLRRLQMPAGEVTEAEVAVELDSLLAAEPDALETLHFAAMEFFIISQEFGDRGAELMALCAQEYPTSDLWFDYQNSIYTFIAQSAQRLGEYERTVFPLLAGAAKETGYFLIMTYALAGRREDRVEDLATSFIKDFPESSLATAFIVTMLQIKYEQPTALWAAEMLEWQKKYSDDLEINIQLAEYYKDRSWKTAAGYYRNAVKNSEGPDAAVLFAEAAAAKNKNFAEASKWLRKAIAGINADYYRNTYWWRDLSERRSMMLETQATLYTALGWLSFKYGKYTEAVAELLTADSLLVLVPAYEEELYRRMLTVSEKAGNLPARQTALLNIMILQPQDRGIQKALEDLYLLDYGDIEGYVEWVEEEQIKISLRHRMNIPVPNFPMTTLADDTAHIIDFAGKVIVINFWATWCAPCKEEMPKLNQLVRDYQDNENVVFIGISTEPTEIIREFLETNTFLYEMYADQPGTLYTLFEVQNIPTHMVIDTRGMLQFYHVGNLANIDKLLEMEIGSLLE
jgi:thiol-disulfide isomerase/thioredoxin